MRDFIESIYEKAYLVMTTLPSGLNVYSAGTDDEMAQRFTGAAQEAKRFTYYDAVNEAYCHGMTETTHVYNRNMKINSGMAWKPVKLS